MQLPADPVRSFEDITLNFEQLQAILTKPGAQLPFLQLLAAKQLQLAIGSGTAVWSGGHASAGVTVTHGIGRMPVFAAAVGGVGNTAPFGLTGLTSTTATFEGDYYTVLTATLPFLWIAIG